jgi:hypothetical protein
MRLPDMPLHDPFIVPDTDTGLYHLYTSSHGFTAGHSGAFAGVDGVGTMVYRSPNLKDWAEPVQVFSANAQDEPWARHGAWAPEVHRYGSHWYLFTTLHDEDQRLPVPDQGAYCLPVPLANYRRSTIVAIADALTGPFTMLRPEAPNLPPELMTLDGTLFIDDDGAPWMVYANEWLQRIDGTIEAYPLTADLSTVAGQPLLLFRGSEAHWLTRDMPAGVPHQIVPYVTDGPQLYRAPGGALVCLWSTYEKNRASTDGTLSGDYVQTYAIADSGRLEGPWRQGEPLVRQDSGHGMLFETFEGQLMMVLHRPFTNARGKLYEMRMTADGPEVIRQRNDLDGD